MPEAVEPKYIRIDHSDKPAGGRGAVKSTFKSYTAQGMSPLKAASMLLQANKLAKFDCPGCAFPDKPGKPAVDSCEQGHKAIAWEMTRKETGPDFFAGQTLDQLRARSDYGLEFQGRLTTPMLYTQESGTYQPISWEKAFAITAAELQAISPDQAAFYASGRSSNEAAFLWQLVARSYGCANLPDSSNFCHESSGFALKQSIGVGKGTCSLDDFEQADLILVVGQNPATNHPRMMGALHEAAARGTKIIAINPLRERGFTNFSDPKAMGEMIANTGMAVAHRIYQVRIGGDLALFKGVMKHLFDMHAQATANNTKPVLDEAFIAEHTTGFEALRADLAAAAWGALVEQSGIAQADICELAEIYAAAPAAMATWCMGITHHENGVHTIQTLMNLLLLRGNIGRAGAGAVPVRGHSNVQGDRTMGATSMVSERWLDNMSTVFPQASITRAAGLDAGQLMPKMFKGEVRAFFTLGGNFGTAAPDSVRVLDGLSRCRFTLHIATKLNRTHCYPGEVGLLLPTLGRTDIDLRSGTAQVVSVEDSMSNVRASRGVQAPLSSNMMSEPAIVANLGAALAPDSGIPWLAMADDYSLIRNAIEQCQRGLVDDFSDYNRKIHEQGRFTLTNTARLRQWKTASGKAEFRVHPLRTHGPVERARIKHGNEVLTLMTVRSHDQFNTTVYGQDDRYRGVFGGRNVLFISQEDLQKRGLQDGDLVDLHSCGDGDEAARVVKGFKVVRYSIPAGCVAAYFPEATPLLHASSLSEYTRTPAYKEIPVLVNAAV
ncbi:MAG TPA: FdhF/YdeP family oxidoreductase [Pseudomonadales bacterium]|jgi:molybdopterin-dependent oxidoreductase alpha subunit|nr:FdhF/YdeP family oxidoreductase [Cellvibrionales bacterium]HRG49810.1 FdhF/YdeP family oxidoreductase [Pseudomonadales bacterium]